MKVLCYCDFGVATGFSNVAENIIYRLAKKLPKNTHFDIIGINYGGDKTEINEKITLYSCKEKAINKEDYYGRDSILRFIREDNYDIFFAINDLAVMSPIYPHLKLLKKQCKARGNEIKYVLYFPIDSPPHPTDIVSQDIFNTGEKTGIGIFDELITYTDYAKDEVMKVIKSHSMVDFLKMKNKIKVIPHGTDTETFHPLPPDEISDFRKEYFRISPDTFLIGQVNRNSSRKDVATSLQAYKIMLDKNSFDFPIKYYMHMNPLDPSGYDLWKVCMALGLEAKDFIFPAIGFSETSGVDKESLNKIYNSFNLFFTTTTAEGWGLSIVEAMACKIPVLVPEHTSIKEIIDSVADPKFYLNCFIDGFQVFDGEFIRHRCHPLETAIKLQDAIELVSKKPWSDNMYENIYFYYHKAISYNWDEIVEKWVSIFRQSKLIVVK